MATTAQGRSDRTGARRVALVSVVWTAAIAAAKLAVGLRIGSVAVLGGAFHSFLDVGAAGLTLAAIRIADRPADREHPYGHGRAENLAALAESVVMVLVGAGVAWEAVQRLMSTQTFDPPTYALVVAAGAIVIDFWRARVLRNAARRYHSPALEADAMNFTADIGESLAVFVGLGIARFGFPAGDPAAALVVVAVMWLMALRVGRSAIDVLMDRSPTDLTERVAHAAGGVRGVVDVGDLRVRQAGPDVHAELTISVGRTSSVEQSHQITEAIEEAVADAVPGATTTVHVEPSREGEDVVARTFAAANRVGMADQVHNVLAIRHDEGLWLMLHAKVPPHMSLRRAHGLSDELEREVRREIRGLARVEIHLEPREARSLRGRDVTEREAELAREIQAIAHGHPPLVRCHEVALSEAGDGLHVVLHCEAAPQTAISKIHDASLEIEAETHRRFPQIRSVTVHFEPETDPVS
jgi:cation diffusion facilitator family transporter